MSSIPNQFSTGHANSPCTIIIGKAHLEKVNVPARPYRMLNDFVINKKMDFSEDLSGKGVASKARNHSPWVPLPVKRWRGAVGVHGLGADGRITIESGPGVLEVQGGARRAGEQEQGLDPVGTVVSPARSGCEW